MDGEDSIGSGNQPVRASESVRGNLNWWMEKKNKCDGSGIFRTENEGKIGPLR